MVWNFREVVCPSCHHKFMLSNEQFDRYHEYIDKTLGELLQDAICPLCSLHFVVSINSLEGIDINDTRVEVKGFRPL